MRIIFIFYKAKYEYLKLIINGFFRELPLTVVYSPISIFYFQMYEAQKMQKQWNNMLGVSEASDEENDIIKVWFTGDSYFIVMFPVF